MKSFFLVALALITFSKSTFAAEPAYCNLKTFLSKEFDPNDKIWRDRAFRMGDVILLGGSMGYSSSKKIVQFTEEYSNATAADKHCVWYFNDSNDNAMAKFNHYYVENPKKLSLTEGPKQYREVLKDQFAKAPINMLSCIEKHKILLMGCDGQMHRGPTVFGMMLAFSGCSSANSLKIVNHLWGKNGVTPEKRQAIIEEGYKLGNADPDARRRMQRAFGY